MTERDVLEFCMAKEENYKKVQYVLNRWFSDSFEHWMFVNRLLGRYVPTTDIDLMNRYAYVWEHDLDTKHYCDWSSYPETEETRKFFERMIEFAHKREAEGNEYNIIDYRGVCRSRSNIMDCRDVCRSIRASSAKNALNKYRRLLTSAGVYSIRKDKEWGEWHLISSYGGDWIARLVMSKPNKSENESEE